MTEAEFNGMTEAEYRRRRQAERARDHRANPNHFATWKADVNAMCLYHLYSSWADLCGDEEPLEKAYAHKVAPLAFVQYWREKYDLEWRD